jgi:hypothetical protein
MMADVEGRNTHVYVHIHTPTYLPTHLPTYIPTYPPTHLPTYLCMYLHISWIQNPFSDGLNRKLVINNFGLWVQPCSNSEHSQKLQSLTIQGTTITINKSLMYNKRKIKAILVTGLDRPWGFQEVEDPRLRNNRHMKVVRSAVPTSCIYPPGNIPGTHFC